MKIGVIGCGAIGSDVARAAEEIDEIDLVFLFDKESERAVDLAEQLTKAVVVNAAENMLAESSVVLETASQEALRMYAEEVLSSDCDLIVLSVGALHDTALRTRLLHVALAHRTRIILPSGAVCGVDGIKAASIAGIEKVTLITTKSPKSLGVECDVPTVLFEGSADEAVRQFPKNINVSAVISLAGIGFKETKVRIVADPSVERNTHHVEVLGAFGRLNATVENVPNPANNKSSYMASLSAIACLKMLISPMYIG